MREREKKGEQKGETSMRERERESSVFPNRLSAEMEVRERWKIEAVKRCERERGCQNIAFCVRTRL